MRDSSLLPLLIEPDELQSHLHNPNLLIVDMNRAETYAEVHLPHAIHLEYNSLVRKEPPAMGMLPSETELANILGAIGLTPDRHVVAYDEEGNSRTTRLLWTLSVLGHDRYSLLNGGLEAWQEEDRPVTAVPVQPTPSPYTAQFKRANDVVDKDWILQHLRDPDVQLLDTRSPGEYEGRILRAARGGHIPGAINFDYVNAMDTARALRLKPAVALRELLQEAGVNDKKEIVVYCQTHHRSSHTFFVLKYLGFPRVKAYPGSWSEWGNLPETPIE